MGTTKIHPALKPLTEQQHAVLDHANPPAQGNVVETLLPQDPATKVKRAESKSKFVREAIARMQSAPRFVSDAEAACYAGYEANGSPVFNGQPPVPSSDQDLYRKALSRMHERSSAIEVDIDKI